MGGGALFPYPTGFLTATVNTGPLKGHTVCHPWAPARSSPLININGHCTKWGHWLLTRGVEGGGEGRLFLLTLREAPPPWGHGKTERGTWKSLAPAPGIWIFLSQSDWRDSEPRWFWLPGAHFGSGSEIGESRQFHCQPYQLSTWITSGCKFSLNDWLPSNPSAHPAGLLLYSGSCLSVGFRQLM